LSLGIFNWKKEGAFHLPCLIINLYLEMAVKLFHGKIQA